jgi:hypothetical protein
MLRTNGVPIGTESVGEGGQQGAPPDADDHEKDPGHTN